MNNDLLIVVVPLVLTQITQIVVLIYGFSTGNKRLDDVNRRLDALDRRLESIERKLDNHNERITRLEERTGPIARGGR
jgi:hypothetical protein